MSEEERRHDFKVEDLKEVMNVISEKVPALLNSLTDAIYGKEASAKFGQAVANFYKTLRDSGMSDEQAFRLTEQYMSSLNLAGLIAKAIRGRPGEGRTDE